MATATQTDELRHELTTLAHRVELLERRLGINGAPTAAIVDLESILPAVRRITQELFPGKFELTEEFDPEYPDDRYVVVDVEATGTPKEIVDRSIVWDERIRQLRPDLWDKLRLFVVPR